jgi:hypothetical protein
VALDALVPLDDLAGKLSRRGIRTRWLALGKFGTAHQLYIPWMQASYIMVANKAALPYLPGGADINALSYDELAAWASTVQQKTGKRMLGFPAGPQGLMHRFFEGFLYPSYTGGVVVPFRLGPNDLNAAGDGSTISAARLSQSRSIAGVSRRRAAVGLSRPGIWRAWCSSAASARGGPASTLRHYGLATRVLELEETRLGVGFRQLRLTPVPRRVLGSWSLEPTTRPLGLGARARAMISASLVGESGANRNRPAGISRSGDHVISHGVDAGRD